MLEKESEKKKCSHCGRYLDLDQFYKSRYQKDGLTNECKDCILDRRRTGAKKRPPQLITKLKNTCMDLNNSILNPSFDINTTMLTIDTLVGRYVEIAIPLQKRIKLEDAEELLNVALEEINVLSNIDGELKIIMSRPILVITGIVKEMNEDEKRNK